MIKYLIITIGILALAVFFLFKQWRLAVDEKDQAVKYALNDSKQLIYYINKAKEEVAKKEAVELDYRTLKQLSADKELQWLKQFEGLKTNLKNLQVATDINTQTIADFKDSHGKDTTVLVNNIPMPAFVVENKTEYINETITVIPELKTASSRIEVTVPIEGVIYWKRPHKFLFIKWGKKEYETEITSPNKATKILKADQILIKPR